MRVRLQSIAFLGTIMAVTVGALWIWRDVSLDQSAKAAAQAERAADWKADLVDVVQLPGQKRPAAEKPDSESAAVLHGVLLKEEVAFSLIIGRLTLPEAAACFRDLDAQKTDSQHRLKRLRINFSGASDEERYCRQVISYAQSLLESLQHQFSVVGVVGRLEAELKEQLKNGTLQLPACSVANDSRRR